MKLGLYLFNTHSRDESLLDCLEQHLTAVRTARSLGFDSVSAGNGFLTHPFQHLQPVPLLGRLAAEAGAMLVGTAVVLLPYYNPVLLAEQAVTLDVITRGRFFLGIGVGFMPHAAPAFGFRPEERVRRLVEYTEIVKRLWSGEEVTASGSFGSLDGVRLGSLPVQRPRPPIYLGADADASVRRAASIADAWIVNPRVGLERLRHQLAIYRAALVDAGRSFPAEIPLRRDIFVAPDSDRAYADANRYPRMAARLYTRGGADASSMTRELRVGQCPDPLIVGNPEECAAQLEGYVRELGDCHFLFRVGWPGMTTSRIVESLELIGQRVMPLLQQRLGETPRGSAE